MSVDVYQVCPCGSGKKLKFCCHGLVADMQKIDRLRAANQQETLLHALEALHAAHPDNPWVATQLVTELEAVGRLDQALALSERLHEAHPDHPVAAGQHAVLALRSQGFAASSHLLQRTLQKTISAAPWVAVMTAAAAAENLEEAGAVPAARAHLLLALQAAEDEKMRNGILESLLAIDSEGAIPHPLRSVYAQELPAEPPELVEACRTPDRFVSIGCFGAAAVAWTRVAEKFPDSPLVHRNLGLCRLWNAEHGPAAAAFRAAAQRTTDFDEAADLEALARCLEALEPGNRLSSRSTILMLGNLDEVLARLEGLPLLARRPAAPRDAATAIRFDLLDRPLPDADANVAYEDMPRIRAVVGLATETLETDAGPRELRGLSLVVYDAGEFDAIHGELRSLLADLLHPLDEEKEKLVGDAGLIAGPPKFLAALWRNLRFPQGISIAATRRLQQAGRQRALDVEWPDTPLPELGGRTPRAAAADPQSRIALAGLLRALEAFLLATGTELDFAPLRRTLGLPDPAPFVPGPDAVVGNLSTYRLLRLDVTALSDDQLRHLVNRVLVLRLDAVTRKLLAEMLARPGVLDDASRHKALQALADLAVRQDDRATLLQIVEQVRNLPGTPSEVFLRELQAEMHVLMYLFEDPADPELVPAFHRMWSRYGAKVPQVRDLLRRLVSEIPYPLPDLPMDDGTPEGGSVTAGGIWTPEAPVARGESKLWVPGMS